MTRALHLFALCGFAIAQPLLDLIARYPELLVARQLGPVEIVLMVLGLLVVPPAALWLLVRGLSLRSPGLASATQNGLVGLLVALTLLPPLFRQGWLPDFAALLGSLALGSLAMGLYARSETARGLTSLLALAPPVFAGLFLFGESVAPLLFESEPESVRPTPIASTTPVVLVVFDELPLSSLQDDRREIDPARYPSFARLAKHSTWYTATTSIAQNTAVAVPAILTGRYPDDRKRLPVARDHPENLFRLLGSAYALEVSERLTRLEPGPGPRADPQESGWDRMAALFFDLALVYLHVVTPEALRAALPPVSDTWGDFGQTELPGHALDSEAATAREGRAGKVDEFRDFVASIEPALQRSGPDRGVLYFLHSGLPHGPWNLLPSGDVYAPPRSYGVAIGRWSREPWWGIDGFRRHLLQLGFADRLLGELLDELERVGLWDSALVIVVADHGLSLWPGTMRRRLDGHSHPEDILVVPLFVKTPGQRVGAVSDRVSETVDILPTIADVLDIAVPWSVDGCSLRSRACPGRAERRAWALGQSGHGPLPLTFPLELAARDDTLERKLRHFGSGARPLGLYRPETGVLIAGSRLESHSVSADSAGSASLKSAFPAPARSGPNGRVPVRVVARLDLAVPTRTVPRVAVVVNGVIETVVPVPPVRGAAAWLSAMLPPESVSEGLTDLALYLVDESGSVRVLRPLDLVP